MSQQAADWVGTWASAQVQPAATGLSATGFTDQTVRNIVHTSVGGSAIRIRISNVFGQAPLAVSGVHVAISESGAATVAGTTTQVLFDGVDVVNPSVEGAVVAFGASTTDGVGSTSGAAKRYPDDLARRLLALPPGQQLSVLNAGIAGNVLLADGGTNGQSAFDRFLRDALEQSGVKAVIIWEGSNDIGAHPHLPLTDLTGAYEQLIAIAHARGIRVIGATLQPDKGASYWTAQGSALRAAVTAATTCIPTTPATRQWPTRSTSACSGP